MKAAAEEAARLEALGVGAVILFGLPSKRTPDGRAGWDPKIAGSINRQCACTPAEIAADTDGDGLTDCEERWLGTLANDDLRHRVGEILAVAQRNVALDDCGA